MGKTKRKTIARAAALCLAMASLCSASGGFVLFKGQVNGPVEHPSGIDLDTFRLRHYPDLFWTEGYYHHMNFKNGAMVTVSIGFNRSDATIAFVYAVPGKTPVTDYLIADFDDAVFDKDGFGYKIGDNRVRLDGDRYVMDLSLDKTKVRIEYRIKGPSYCYGDCMVRYPDGDTFMYYSFPIPWAKAKVRGVSSGTEISLDGSGDMNHDAGVIFPAYTPSNWQVFWFFGDDHMLAVTDHYTHPKFGRTLTQRLVFENESGMFSSTSFDLKWDDWEHARDIPFRYPRHWKLSAEAGGAKLTGEVRMDKMLLMEDLYSNLPSYLRLIAEHLTRNGWTADYWADYNLTYTHDGKTEKYQGRGIVRWTDLEEEK